MKGTAMSHEPPLHFILPRQPKRNDKRPRNAFGYLISFGEMYAAYYAKKDAEKANSIEGRKP